MNKGARLAYGDIIGIINSDDWYEKDDEYPDRTDDVCTDGHSRYGR